MQRKDSSFFAKGKVTSSKLLIEDKLNEVRTPTREAGVSALYLPASKRVFSSMPDELKAKVAKPKKAKQPKKEEYLSASSDSSSQEGEDLDKKRERMQRRIRRKAKRVQFENQDKDKQEGNESAKKRHEKRMQRRATKQLAALDEAWRKRKPKRKLSFSEGMMKYDDASNLKNPLRDAKGPSIMKAKTIKQMMKACKFPVREPILHIPFEYEFFIDSITTAAYNSDELESNAEMGPDVPVPNNSEISVYDYGLSESSSDEEDEEPAPKKEEVKKEEEKPKVEKKVTKKPEKVKAASLELHAFDINELGAYPSSMQEGDIPWRLLAEKLGETGMDRFKHLGMISDNMQAVFDKGKMFPTMKQTQLAYE